MTHVAEKGGGDNFFLRIPKDTTITLCLHVALISVEAGGNAHSSFLFGVIITPQATGFAQHPLPPFLLVSSDILSHF